MVAKDKDEERIREELFQSQKMEAIGTLAGGVAHDFKNMLQGILGYESLLRMKTPVDDPTYRPIEIIEHSAEKAAELTKQLLGFARKGKYVIEPCNLNMVIDDVLRIITRTFPRTVDIRTNLWGDLWTVEAAGANLTMSSSISASMRGMRCRLEGCSFSRRRTGRSVRTPQ